MERRTFLQHMGALGAAAGFPAGASAKAYDPAARYEIALEADTDNDGTMERLSGTVVAPSEIGRASCRERV